jgi:hypothetical protein
MKRVVKQRLPLGTSRPTPLSRVLAELRGFVG